MAKQEKSASLGLLKHLKFAPEAREDGGVSAPVTGRFKYFGSVFGAHNGQLLLANLLFIVTLLPLLAVFVTLSVLGPEKLGYWLKGVTETPYFLSGVGIGLSNASDVLAVKIQMLSVYYWAFLFAGIGVFIAGIGLSGMMHLCVKFIWNDSFVTKKDSYGNDVPRVIVEFFRGIKKYWWQTLIATLIAGVIVGGVGNIYVFFLSRFWAGTAGAGEWILIILASIIAVFGLMFVLLLLPTIVMYDMNFADKMRNAAIFTVSMPLQNLFLLIAVAAPFVIAAVTSGFVSIIFAALLLVFGGAVYGLMTANYVQYLAEKIVTPVYAATSQKSKRPAKKRK